MSLGWSIFYWIDISGTSFRKVNQSNHNCNCAHWKFTASRPESGTSGMAWFPKICGPENGGFAFFWVSKWPFFFRKNEDWPADLETPFLQTHLKAGDEYPKIHHASIFRPCFMDVGIVASRAAFHWLLGSLNVLLGGFTSILVDFSWVFMHGWWFYNQTSLEIFESFRIPLNTYGSPAAAGGRRRIATSWGSTAGASSGICINMEVAADLFTFIFP